ncbi:ATPase [Mycolicibacterium murale]|uniref:histidine kinase n=1 Tax=Mycolicibacterium murale TaxID=182220 RepID=A0A7I9WML8_9MYCO|nr:sensor histidine kinase [Mycolicibacterium murale]MCV7185891.1 sensor histidine kinase [Mycolicibacterium murale]GFG58809.1 ATPase [Mycolicibacterium murale]
MTTPTAVRRLGRLPLARQLLVLQFVLILAVLGVVVAITYVQSTNDFQRSTGNRLLSLAETFAADQLVRSALRGDLPLSSLPPAAARLQSVSGADFVMVMDRDGVVLAGQDPSYLSQPWSFASGDVLSGRAWVGPATLPDGKTSIQAHVPVLDPDNRGRLGYVVIGSYSRSIAERLEGAVPDLLIYLGVASALGLLGSVLLANRIKRQTFGLEPHDIAGLVEHREALLYGIREGVLGLDLDHRVTIVNAEAIELLNLPGDAVGQRLEKLALSAEVIEALTDKRRITDRILDTDARRLVLNRMPVTTRGRVIGAVVTLRDRTELWGLQQELNVTRHTADALRAQTHEFSNRLHTIAGLLKLGHVERAQRYVTEVQTGHNTFLKAVTSRIEDTTLAALVVAKGSLASERGVELSVDQQSHIGALPLDLAADLETVLGNFVDNALEACVGTPGATITLLLTEHDDRIWIEVRDNGPGVDDAVMHSIFERGVSTKSADQTRGIGLALARSVCERRGGRVAVHNDDGAVFTAEIPVSRHARTAG